MPKIFTYRGKTVEELQQLSLEQLAQLFPARQRRTLKRGLTEVEKKLLEKVKKNKAKEKPVRTKVRDMLVLPEMVGAKLAVYNGKEYVQINIIPEMIAMNLGEFVLTRKRVQHGQPGFGATRGSKYVPLK
jgi:small subunit ribosomal protein S19